MNDLPPHLALVPVLVAIHERHSVRDFTAKLVSDREIDMLLDAAVAAPSAMNVQPWAFVVVQDPELVAGYEDEARATLTSDPPPEGAASIPTDQLAGFRELLDSGGFTIFHGAPALIVIYATNAGGVPDCFLAAENVLLAAVELGLGTCPVGLAIPFFERPDVKERLDVPAGHVVALPIVVGVPAGRATPPPHEPPRILARLRPGNAAS